MKPKDSVIIARQADRERKQHQKRERADRAGAPSRTRDQEHGDRKLGQRQQVRGRSGHILRHPELRERRSRTGHVEQLPGSRESKRRRQHQPRDWSPRPHSIADPGPYPIRATDAI